MMGKNNQIKSTLVANKVGNIGDADKQRLYEGFVVMAKIIAKEIAGELATSPQASSDKFEVERAKSNLDPNGRLPATEKLVLSCSEVAKLLGLSTNMVYKLIRENKIPHLRYYRRILISQVELKKHLNDASNGIGN